MDQAPQKIDLITVAGMAREHYLVEWVCTYSEDFQDPEVLDMEKYRAYLLEAAAKYEKIRAQLVGVPALPIVGPARSMLRMLTGPNRRSYTHGLQVRFQQTSIAAARKALENL